MDASTYHHLDQTGNTNVGTYALPLGLNPQPLYRRLEQRGVDVDVLPLGLNPQLTMGEPTEITLTEVYQKYLGSNRALVLQNIPEDVGADVLQNYLEVVLHITLVHVSYTCNSRAAVVAVFKEDLKDLNSYRGDLDKRQLSGRHIALASLGGVVGVVVPGIASRDVSEDTLLYYFESKKGSGGHEECVSQVEIHQTGDQRHGVVHIGTDRVINAILSRDHVLNGKCIEVQPYFPSLHDCIFRRRTQTRSHSKPCQEVLPFPRYPTEPLDMSENKNGQETLGSSKQSQGISNQLSGHIFSPKQVQAHTNQYPDTYYVSYQSHGNPNTMFMGPSTTVDCVQQGPVVAKSRGFVDMQPVQKQSDRPTQGWQIDDKVPDRRRIFLFKDEIRLDEVRSTLLRHSLFIKQNRSDNVNIDLCDTDGFRVKLECTTEEQLIDMKIKLFEMLQNLVEKDEQISECRWKLLSRQRNKALVEKLLIDKKSKAFVKVGDNKQVLCCAAFDMLEINKALMLIKDGLFVEEIDVHHDKRGMIKSEGFERLHRTFDVGECAILYSESSSKIYIEGFERDKVRQARDKMVEYLKKTQSKQAAPKHTTPEHVAPKQKIEMKLNGAQAKCFESCVQGELQQKIRSMGGVMEVTKIESRDNPMRLKVNITGDEAALQLARDTVDSIWHERVDFKKISDDVKDIELVCKGLDREAGKEFFRGFENKHGCFIDVTTEGMRSVAKATVTQNSAELSSSNHSAAIRTRDTSADSVSTPFEATLGADERIAGIDYDSDLSDGSEASDESDESGARRSRDGVMHQDPSSQTRRRELQKEAVARPRSWHDRRQLSQQFQGDLSPDTAEELAIMMSLDQSGATADPVMWKQTGSGTKVRYVSDESVDDPFDDDDEDMVDMSGNPTDQYENVMRRDVNVCRLGLGRQRSYSDADLEGTYMSSMPDDSVAPSSSPDSITSSRERTTGHNFKEDSCMIKKTKILLRKGEIAKERASALVNLVAPSQNIKESIVSRSFCATGGPEFERMWTDLKFKPGLADQYPHVWPACGNLHWTDTKFEPGLAGHYQHLKVTRKCGKLRCDYVLHVTLKKVHDQAKMKQCLNEAMEEIFEVCMPNSLARQGCTYIAMPPLGVGRLYNYPLDLVARCMLTQTRAFLQSEQFAPKEVKFVIYDDDTYAAFKTVLDSLGQHSRADSTSRPMMMSSPTTGPPRSNRPVSLAHSPRSPRSNPKQLLPIKRSASSVSLLHEIVAPLVELSECIDNPGSRRQRDRNHRNTSANRNGDRKSQTGVSSPSRNNKHPSAKHKQASQNTDDKPRGRMKVEIFAENREKCTAACNQLCKDIKEEFLHIVRIEKRPKISKEARNNIARVVSKNNIISEKGNGKYTLKGKKQSVKEAEREIIKILQDDKIMVATSAEDSEKRRNNRERFRRGTHEFVKHMVSEDDETPLYWKNFQPGEVLRRGFTALKSFVKNSKHCKVNLDTSDPAYEAILKLMNKTFDSSSIGKGNDAKGLDGTRYSKLYVVKIQRIENIDLYKKYAAHRKDLFQALCRKESGHFAKLQSIRESTGDIKTIAHTGDALKKDMYWELNEQLFFHGTKADIVDKICDQGLDSRVGDENAMFGPGVYGAESSTKADQYTDSRKARTYGKGEHKTMMLIRMALGNMYVCTKQNPEKYKRPPCTSCYKHNCTNSKHRELFDSVVGDNGKLFREFVVYSTDHCYPEYLITYERR